jgi:hypothetical protein
VALHHRRGGLGRQPSGQLRPPATRAAQAASHQGSSGRQPPGRLRGSP